MKYRVIRTDVPDEHIRNIILSISEKFGIDVALEKLDDLERSIQALAENPDMGIVPDYLVLKRQGYRILIVEKNLVFYKVDERKKEVIVYAVVDQRRDYLKIIRGL